MVEAVAALERLYELARTRVRERVLIGAKLDPARLEREQLATHALAYLRTQVEASRQLQQWASGAHETLIAQTFIAELCRELRGGVALGQTETVGLSELGIGATDWDSTLQTIEAWADQASSAAAYAELARSIREHGFGAAGLSDETLRASQASFHAFVDAEVKPLAREIHRQNLLIPDALLKKLSELGVFGLTIPGRYGGLGLGKVAMCVVTEELSRGYLGVGSLGTRAEIAGELILGGGTDAQKERWLPKIASGEVLPTAVFTEPNHGSDLAAVQTRAERTATGWVVHGQKTWSTHAARADLMTLLARSKPGEKGYPGLSMFLAEKTRCGAPDQPEFVDPGLSGTEIAVLGYRGMKEYELSFDGFAMAPDALLGAEEGQGFKQLMTTFESARIQTAARGVGVAQAALDEAFRYAHDRRQFGKPILEFPRVARKLSRMVCLVQAARQLTFHAAAMKDGAKRCDLEAGMAKLFATRAAWECADACVQIHGGNGYAEEYTASRLLVDARVLSLFEGANEIQAQVVARRLLE